MKQITVRVTAEVTVNFDIKLQSYDYAHAIRRHLDLDTSLVLGPHGANTIRVMGNLISIDSVSGDIKLDELREAM